MREYEIKAISPIIQITEQLPRKTNNEYKTVGKTQHYGKTFEDYINECRKSDTPIIHVDYSKTVDKVIPYYCSISTKEVMNVDILKVKMAYEGEIIEEI